jgi:hypothetical protein
VQANLMLTETVPVGMARAFAQDTNWAVLVPRLPKAGLLPDDPGLIGRIVATHR